MDGEIVTAPKRTSGARLVTWLALVLLTACAKGGSVAPQPPGPEEPPGEIRVENANSAQATVYLLVYGSDLPHRIGTVPALGAARLTIPRPYATQDIQFLVRLFASGDEYTTEQIQARNVDLYVLRIGPEVGLTTLVIP
jgi:hypothetical protein